MRTTHAVPRQEAGFAGRRLGKNIGMRVRARANLPIAGIMLQERTLGPV